MHNFTFFCLKKKTNQCIVDIWGSMYRKAIQIQPLFKYIFYIKIWHAASNNGINLFKIIVINNHNYNLKGIIDHYDFVIIVQPYKLVYSSFSFNLSENPAWICALFVNESTVK